MINFGLIGYGGIGRSIVDIINTDETADCQCVAVLARHGQAADKDDNINFVFSLSSLLDSAPQIVIECAGHEALHSYGAKILERGVDLAPASIGALADETLFEKLKAAAGQGGGKLILPAGAIGGIDALVAARASGLERVKYRSRKPALAWRGTPAEQKYDLSALKEAAVFFVGNAREAACLYPKNANVAATIALAGLGFSETEVELVADPMMTENIHEIEVSSRAGSFSMRLQGNPSRLNPKTSMLTAYSYARALQNLDRVVVI